MKISKEQIGALIGIVAKTSNEEISCQTCEDQIAQFAESELKGVAIPDALKVIEDHLKICPECSEELEFIRRALTADSSRQPDSEV